MPCLDANSGDLCAPVMLAAPAGVGLRFSEAALAVRAPDRGASQLRCRSGKAQAATPADGGPCMPRIGHCGQYIGADAP